MSPISARSRRADEVSDVDASSRVRASAAESTGVEPYFTEWLGPRTACAGLDGDDLADDEPVEQHADAGQVLLDGRPGEAGPSSSM